VKRTIVNAR